MSDKVEYGKIVVQVDQIMQKLHQVAKENSRVEEDGYSLFNSLVDTDSPANGITPTIILRKAEPIDVKEKRDFFKKIQDYVKYFAGENYAQKISEEQLVPIFTNDNLNGGETKQEKPQATSESKTEARIFLNNTEKKAFAIAESLFNFNETVINEETDVKSGENESGNDDNPEDKVYGYSVGFLFYRGGQSVNAVGLGSKGKRFLSGMWADMANLKIKTLGGGEIPVGGTIAKVTRFFTRTKININDADNFIKNILNNDYPQSSAIVRGYDVNSLKQYLMKSDQWNPDYEKLFKNCEYAITIEVEKKDKSYEQYSKEVVANICTRAFGDALKIAKNPFVVNKVGPDQVIKIENYRSEFRNQSIYNRRSGGRDGASSTNESVTSFDQKFKNGYINQILESLFDNQELLTEKKHLFKINFYQEDPPLSGKKGKKLTYVKVERGKRIDPSSIPSLDIIPDIDGYKRPEKWEPDPLTFDGSEQENHCIARYLKEEDSEKDTKQEQDSNQENKQDTNQAQDSSQNIDDGYIEVDFRVKDPRKENALSHSIGIVSAKPGKFKTSGKGEGVIPTPQQYKGFRFRFWNPDPNEFTSNQSKKENGKVNYYPNISNAEYVKDDSDGQGNDFYIVPHKCLVSKNRKDDYEVANDGTVTAKKSKQDYKRSDFTR